MITWAEAQDRWPNECPSPLPSWLYDGLEKKSTLREFNPLNRAFLWGLDQRTLLTVLLELEASGESEIGRFAIAHVVNTRRLLPWWWGDTMHECALMPWQFSCFWGEAWNRKHFDFRARDVALNPWHYPVSQRAAERMLVGEPNPIPGATHYFNPNVVLPSWAGHMVRLAEIGNHAFYGYGL